MNKSRVEGCQAEMNSLGYPAAALGPWARLPLCLGWTLINGHGH